MDFILTAIDQLTKGIFMDNINVDQLHDLLPDLGDNDLILDVRSKDEFDEGHIKGARNMPHEEVRLIADELSSHTKVYVHCKMGGRAKAAAEDLVGSGLANIVCVSKGGMHRWAEMGWPVEK